MESPPIEIPWPGFYRQDRHFVMDGPWPERIRIRNSHTRALSPCYCLCPSEAAAGSPWWRRLMGWRGRERADKEYK